MGLDEAIEAEAQAQAICMADQATSAAPTTPSWPSRSRCSRAIEPDGPSPTMTYLDWPFFEQRDTATCERDLDAWAGAARARTSIAPTTSTPPAARWCAQLGDAGWLRHASPAPPTAAR